MSRTRVMLIGALPVGTQSHRMPMYSAGGSDPRWQRDFISTATTVREEPQNLMRVNNSGSGPFRMSSQGGPSVPLESSMLGRLGAGDSGGGYFADQQAKYAAMVAASDPAFVTATERVIYWLALGQRLMGASVGAYHGYKRNRGSMGAAVGWGIAGAVAPVITIGVGLYQGLAQPKR